MHRAPSNIIFNCNRDYSSKNYEHSVSNCDRPVFEMIFPMPSNFPFSVKSSTQKMPRSISPWSQATWIITFGRPTHDFETPFSTDLLINMSWPFSNQLYIFSQNNLALEYSLMPSQMVSHQLILTFSQSCMHLESFFSVRFRVVCKVCGEYSLKFHCPLL